MLIFQNFEFFLKNIVHALCGSLFHAFTQWQELLKKENV
jgi:hypothetical protein